MIRKKIELLKTSHTIEEKQKQIKKICMKMLQAFSCVCSKYNLKWWIDGGTLLGAARNNEMIIWDDDIDVVMLREDYNKLLKLAEKNTKLFGASYFFQTAKTDEYFETFAKLRDINTTALTPREYGMKHVRGMFIDIFPLDNVPQNSQFCEDIAGFVKTVAKHTGQDRQPRFQTNYWDMLNNVLTDVNKRNESSECIANTAFWRYDRQITTLKKVWYDETKMTKLEDMLVPIPHMEEQVLTTWYGELWRIPKQTVFHGYVDPFISYEEYNNLTDEEFYYLTK